MGGHQKDDSLKGVRAGRKNSHFFKFLLKGYWKKKDNKALKDNKNKE